MEIYYRRYLISPFLLFLVYHTIFVDSHSQHIRHFRERFKRQQGAHLYLPGSYVTDSDDPDAGPWQDWSAPSPCSRTCGGGVSTQYRSCTPGYRCQGSSKRHFSCNTQDCPDTGDFRSQQCSEFDDIPFEGVRYQWVPYTKAPNPCELNCMPRGERFYYRHRLHVSDGTRCSEDKLDVCVDGKCQAVGCDMMLGSNAREDKCRNCGGDGTTCSTITGILDMQDLQVGYNDILLIPAGATNINVRERSPSNNYLAIRNTSGHYHLNGNWRIDFPRTLEFSGCKFHYNRYPQGFSAPDSVSCIGPTDEALFIVLLYQDTNVGVEYEYSVPQNIVQSTENETYAWTFDQFTPCTSTCGGGIQYRNVSCAGRRTLEPADTNLCDPSNRPVESQRCNDLPCDARWLTKPWEKCSAPCGVGGSQKRKVLCEQVIANGVASIVHDEQCANIQKPQDEQPCNQGAICAEWHTGPWKPCDRLCGEGKETRVVTCYRKVNGKIEKLNDEDCLEEKPEEEKTCNVRPCEGVDWVTSDWSGCDKCGLNSETRRVQCATASGEVYPDSLCEGEDKPEVEQDCKTTSTGCDYEWYASQWSECSAKCGTGIRTRKVFCAGIENLDKVGDEKCDSAKKYEASMECETELDECTGEWFSGPWSKCTKDCGGGEKTRQVICFRDNMTVDATECGPESIPSGSESCNQQPCSGDEVIPVDITKPPIDEATGSTKEGPELFELIPSTDKEGSPDDDYEIIDTDDCEDGEWVDAEEFEALKLSTVYSSSISSDETSDTSIFGSSTVSSFSDVSTESSLATDDLMLSDATGTAEESESTIETGSGEEEETKPSTESVSKLTELTDMTDEGSGDEETVTETGKSDITESDFTKVSELVSEDQFTTSSDGLSSSSGVSDSVTSLSSSSGVSDSVTSLSSSSDVSDHASSLGTTEGLTDDSSSDVSVSKTITESSSEAPSSSEESSSPSDITDTTIVTESNTQETSEVTSESPPSQSTEDISSSATDSTIESGSSTTSEKETDVFSEETGETTTAGTGETSEIASSSAEMSSTPSEESTESTGSTSEFTGSSDISATDASPLPTDSSPTATDSSPEATDASPASVDAGPVSTDSSPVSTDSSPASTDSSPESTDSSPVSTDSGPSSTDASPISTDSSPISPESTSEPSTDTTESPESTTEFTGSTESTSEEITGSSETSETDIWSSTTESGSTEWGTTDITELFTPMLKKCKRKKPKDCKKTTYGCCYDKITPAEGPFDKGCPMPKTCKETKYGCCEDDVSPALGKKFKGCPSTHCDESLFGCCSDKKTPAEGENDEGCPPPPPKCLSSKYGCCEDNITEAKGPKGKGCQQEKEKDTDEDCVKSQYGCCPDKKTPAQGEFQKGCKDKENCAESTYGCCPDGEKTAAGPNFRGCKTPCSESPFGCCEDGITPAHGYNREGCCLATPHGCCPDNIKPAEGPNLEGCGCEYSPYKCCPDNVTPARGYSNEGCGCTYTEHGCCPDSYTPAAGAEYQGCLCHTFQFGCCPDGISIAKGPHQQGCGCRNTEFGCCSDNQTPASGANMEGCGCSSTKYGCCLDGTTEAQGDNFEGCEEIPVNVQGGCLEPKERGPCRNYTVKWYFDMEYGGCSRFWYGGCDGNNNRYKSQEECKDICIEPPGKDRCKLPKVAGPCEGYYPQWYYDKDRNHCAQFIYSGCLGNNNKFETSEECINECVEQSDIDACDQPKEEGPCKGQNLRWYFNKENSRCEHFYYGGCKPNSNNFPTEMACNQQCSAPNRKKDHCSLPRAQGTCTGREPRWFYDASETRCMPFYYSSCEGNNNNFISEEDCKRDCPEEIEKDTCFLPAETGECANYTESWYYDTTEKQCRQFYYGGCGGNGNNFPTEDACLLRCEPKPEQPSQPSEGEVDEPFKTEFCFLPNDSGPCRDTTEARWYYDRDGVCKQFLFGGCEGNQNNFKTDAECRQMCGNAQDLCTLPKVIGPCNAERDQYYYDYQTDMCDQFKYGGCLGNDNRFDNLATCEQRCKRGPITATQSPPVHVPQVGDDTAICYSPVDPGHCNESYAAYYYDAESQRCLTFSYSGCGGNANRYTSEEQCERQCGKFRGQDVCNLPRDSGPCRGYFIKTFFDSESRQCADFVYGGCDGNGNRFSSIQECQNICMLHEEHKPTITSNEICRLPVDVGACGQQGSHKRWYFDDLRGECIAFIYSGCGGNFNRFRSFTECSETCRDFISHPYNEIDSNLAPESTSNCDNYQEECKSLHCPYGIRAYVDESQCTRCSCYNPCDGYQCPHGSQCAIDINNNKTSEQDEPFVPVCREVNKPGSCPNLEQSNEQCYEECRNDADCTVDLKCCSTGCGTSCVAPHMEVPAELVTSGYQPAYTEPPILAGYYAPQIDTEIYEPEVAAREGESVKLNCAIRGNPNPKITWNKGNLVIDGSQPRYRILLDGNLQIITLHKTDSGLYLCTADNNLGRPLTNQIELNVTDGVNFPATVFEVPEDESNVVVSLGSPASLQCFALGFPFPTVTWWKNDVMIPLKTSQYEQRKDFSLLIHRVELIDLGLYTCQAYNGVGKATSWTVTVQAQGPVYSNNPDDQQYMKYIVNPPQRPETAKFPEYPYRPQRPSPPPVYYRPTPQPFIPNPYTEPSPEIDIRYNVPENNVPESNILIGSSFVVPVRTNITVPSHNFGVGSDVSIPCDVDGYPVPQVNWFKDNSRIYTSNRYEITESSRLIVKNANQSDSGIYKCEAFNDYSRAESEVSITVEGVHIHPDCTDNPFFANCKLIVQHNYCIHKYYARFCCRSCTQAGRLPSYGPHLGQTHDDSSNVV